MAEPPLAFDIYYSCTGELQTCSYHVRLAYYLLTRNLFTPASRTMAVGHSRFFSPTVAPLRLRSALPVGSQPILWPLLRFLYQSLCFVFRSY